MALPGGPYRAIDKVGNEIIRRGLMMLGLDVIGIEEAPPAFSGQATEADLG